MQNHKKVHEWTQAQDSVCETLEQFIYKRHQVLYKNVQRKTGAPGNPGTGRENHTPVGHTHEMLLFCHTLLSSSVTHATRKHSQKHSRGKAGTGPGRSAYRENTVSSQEQNHRKRRN